MTHARASTLLLRDQDQEKLARERAKWRQEQGGAKMMGTPKGSPKAVFGAAANSAKRRAKTHPVTLPTVNFGKDS